MRLALLLVWTLFPVTYLHAQERSNRSALLAEVQALTKLIERRPDDRDLYELRAEAFAKLGLKKLEQLDRLKLEKLGPKQITNAIGMRFSLIPAGEFMMGSPASEHGRDDDERQHRVRISREFYLGTTEVTQSQWHAVMDTQPWEGQKYTRVGPAYPAGCIKWEDANEFCRRLSVEEGMHHRLPTEAEWEYACRAGSDTAYSFGNDRRRLADYAWFRDNARDVGESYLHRVAQKRPSRWGLYDMHGNVREWCSDAVSEGSDYRVHRGGTFGYPAEECRSASRDANWPDITDGGTGFRVLRVVGTR